jgi:hypothetical protein
MARARERGARHAVRGRARRRGVTRYGRQRFADPQFEHSFLQKIAQAN